MKTPTNFIPIIGSLYADDLQLFICFQGNKKRRPDHNWSNLRSSDPGGITLARFPKDLEEVTAIDYKQFDTKNKTT